MAAIVVHIDVGRRSDSPRDGGAALWADPSSLAALLGARGLASSWGATLYAIAIVADPEATTAIAALKADLLAAGADRIVIATVPHAPLPLWASIGGAWQVVLDKLRPRLALFGADAPSAPELAARTGAKLGARLLARARVSAGDHVELRAPDGTYVRASDSGAAVATIGTDLASTRALALLRAVAGVGRAATNPDVAASLRASADGRPIDPLDVHADTHPIPVGPDDITDPQATATTVRPAIEIAILATKAAADPRVEVTGTRTVVPQRFVLAIGDDATEPGVATAARELGARLGATVVEAGTVDEAIAFAPELYLQVGAPVGDLAGAASLVRLGVDPADRRKGDDGTLPAPLATALADLTRALGELP